MKELHLNRGIFIVSIDLELAWGFNYELLKGSQTAMKYLKIIKERSRYNVRKLLEMSEHYKIPFTWGVVGHLFLSSCSRNSCDMPHPDMPRPNLDVSKDWYSNDPCTNADNAPLWYGPDIIKQILDSKVEHEIACHTFSHVDLSKCSAKVALAEIRKCKEVMKDYGIHPKTFIFPKNRVNYIELLKQEGFKVFRFRIENPYCSSLTNKLKEIFFPTIAKPIELDDLIGVPSSLLFQSSHFLDISGLQIITLRGINKATKENRIFHIIMHDYIETDALLGAFMKVLKYAAKLRQKSLLNVGSMVEFYLCRG